jgi:F0F1-type ATP synthase, delta subunit (mitochondrial oligomycin sensitivity protein)
MARKISRRSLALYVATHLASGKPQKEIALQLGAYLVSTRRTKELDSIIRDIQFYLADHGHIAGSITSAHELSASTMKAIESFAKDKTGAKHVSFDRSIDESLIGGVKIEIPGYELDSTVARQLTILKTRYKKA